MGREIRMLEEEGEQLRLADALREEGDRLNQQRRSVALLQAGALRMLDSATARPEGGCLEVSFDAGDGEDETEQKSDSDTDDDEVWDLDWSQLPSPGPGSEEAARVP